MIDSLKQLKREDTIINAYYFNYYKVTDKRTGDSYLARISNENYGEVIKIDINRIFEEINIIPLLDHPSISKFIFHSRYDFKKKDNPTLITEYCSQGPLSEIIYNQPSVLTDTNKLIIIYGIASGMSYLHSHDILHCDLKTSNIWLDYRYFPKINGFSCSERINNNLEEEKRYIKGTPAYISPEIYKFEGQSKSSDVYSYSLLIYELLHNKRIFEEIKDIKEIRNKIINNERPNITTNISNKYKELIERCWNEDPNLRPTFEDIVNELETDHEYITNNIEEEEYRKYIKYIKKSKITYGISNNLPNIDDIIESNKSKTKTYKPEFRGIYETEMLNINYFLNEVDYNNYKKLKTIIPKGDNIVSIYEDKITQKKYTVKEPKMSNISFYQYLNFDINFEDNPCILKFQGHFIKNKKIGALFNYCSNNTLNHVIELQRNKKCTCLTDTKKLIIIYGIASAMSYLHSHNILHLNLNSKFIYLDDHLHPKVSEFYDSLKIPNYIEPNSIFYYQKKISSIHDSPEFFKEFKVSKSHDVYSFSMILYEILTEDEIIIDEKNQSNFKFISRIIEGERPKFKKQILKYYQDLIERCWSSDPTKRPTFDDIIKELETNPTIINENIDKDEYLKYIDYTKGKASYDSDDVIYIQQEKKHLSINIKQIELNQFSKQNKIGAGSFGKVYKVLNKKTNEIQACKVSILCIDDCSDLEIHSMERELSIISKLKFPSVLRFVGFSLLNFKNQERPTFITELVTNGSLDVIIDLEQKGLSIKEWNDTKKLINIYGIALGMSYLHSMNILHRDLKPGNIFVDEYLFPKIGDFGLSKEIQEKSNEYETNEQNNIPDSGNKGTIPYMSPEILESNQYTKAGDVYAFAFIVYEIITNEELYKNWISFQIMFNVAHGYRPSIDSSIPKCYRELIESCWHQDPEQRPTFDEVVDNLKNNPDFITETVDQDEFFNYIDLIEEMISRKDSPNEIDHLKNNENLLKISINKKLADDLFDENDPEINKCFINLSLYEKIRLHDQGFTWKLYEIRNKNTGHIYSAKITTIKLNKMCKKDLVNLSREINNISQVEHPSILKFIGYSLSDFSNKKRPVIVTEFAPKGSISEILSRERKGKIVSNWDSTKKLINIYGIASGMKYLHSNKILHRDLTPENIYLDDNLYPKIGNFGLSTQVHTQESLTYQSTIGVKGNPVYSAPEVLQYNEYSKSSDVYSFGLIIYSIMTGNIPFENINSLQKLFNEVITKCKRPEFDIEIEDRLRQLIEICWSQNPNDRPTFENIVDVLENDPAFITDDIDQEQYKDYIKFINNSKIEFHSDRKIFQQKKSAGDVKQNTIQKESSDSEESFEYDEIVKLKEKNILFNGIHFNYYKVCRKNTDNFYLARISNKSIENYSEADAISLKNEISIISSLSHPSISKFILYSLKDFDDENCLTLITEYCSQGPLSEIIYNQPSVLTDTNKLIIIYGIASGMSYLHSHDILHCDLKTSNIWLDYRYFPKINGFNNSERINNNFEEEKRYIKGTPAYISPEIYKFEGKSKSSDVYSYSLLIYELLHNKRIFEEIKDIKEIRNKIINNERPNITTNISNKYKELIERCWNEDPNSRPAFEDIVNELETDREYITNNIEEEEYRKYIKYIKKSKITYEISNNLPNIDDIIESNKISKNICQPQFRGIYETEILNINYFLNEVDYNNYKKLKTIIPKGDYRVSIYEDKITQEKYIVKEPKMSNISFYQYLNIDLNFEDNPCILKFQGYFLKNKKIGALFNYCSNNTLNHVIELQRNKKCTCLTDTKKLIIIYGIASAMSYLHSHNILHLNLNSKFIYLDDHLHPKVSDFYDSLKIPNHIEPNSIFYYQKKISSIHDSPEYIKEFKVSKSHDVYSFSMILYEILTEDEIEIGEKNQPTFNIIKRIIEGERPKFKKQILKYYQDLIERCWSSDPTKRPTFDDIIKELETNPTIIDENIDKDEFFKYIEDIKRETNEPKTEKSNELKLSSEKIEHSQIETESNANQVSESNLNDFEIVMLKKNKKHKKIDRNENLNEKLDKYNEKDVNKSIEIQNSPQENSVIKKEEEKKELNENMIEDQKEVNKFIDTVEVSTNLNQKEDKKSKVNENRIIKETTSIQNDNLITDESGKKADKNSEEIQLMKSVKIDEFEKINETDTEKTIDNIIKESNSIQNDKSSKNAEKNAKKIEEYEKINETEQTNENESKAGENEESSNQAPFIEENDDLIANFQKQEKTHIILDTIEYSNPHEYNGPNSKDVSNHNKSEDNVDEFIKECIATNRMKDLFDFLVQHNYSNEKISSIFNYVYENSNENYDALCEEGILQNNCVAHHKQALNLICKGKEENNEKIKASYFNESLAHFEESIHQGFIDSYYSLSLLYHEFLKDDESAIKCAKEGLEKGDCRSMFLYGYFKIRGIGMKKNRQEGVKYILESGMKNVHQFFATDIGLFYVEQHENTKLTNNEQDQHDEIDENSIKAFEWFLKAFENHKTKATINNYGLCFLKGFGVQKNIQKAFEIFQEGSKLGDSNSKYHLSFIYYHYFDDPIKSQQFLKEASDNGHLYAKQQYLKMIYSINKSNIDNDEQNEMQTLNEEKVLSVENNESCVHLAKKYSKENDAENTYIYMKKCIKEKRSEVVLEYAINLYKHKKFNESKKYFDLLIEINHPIARYFDGVMKYFGQGCTKNRNESEKIMKNLAESGIDCASEFLLNYFNI